VAVPGWSHPAALAALAWARCRSRAAVLMSDSTAWDEPRLWHKETVKRLIVSRFGAALVAGKAHASYLARLGMEPERIATGYDVVDNTHFARGVELVRAGAVAERARRGLHSGYFLASARFVKKKNLFRLLRAYARYRAAAEADPWGLVVLGDGPLRTPLEALRAELGLADCVALPGFKQYDELPLYYGLAGAFVHPSTTEQWGLVVNEAMAAGLPVLVSRRCGCAIDLVETGENGFCFDPYDVEELARLLRQVAGGTFDLGDMGRASARIIAAWSPQAFAEGMQTALAVATARPLRPLLGEQWLLWLLARR
jgi:glycosyltransferase involved in cell wall biosynthesis